MKIRRASNKQGVGFNKGKKQIVDKGSFITIGEMTNQYFKQDWSVNERN